MTSNKHGFQVVMISLCLLVLIFDSRTALEGARTGIELCIGTVIPSMFPFFVLSIILTNMLTKKVSTPLLLITRPLGIPNEAASVLISSVFGGYPVGAKTVCDLYHHEHISRYEAERLLAFCSNAGPSFLFGMVSGFFPSIGTTWLLWLIHIISAGLTALTIPAIKTENHHGICDRKTADKTVILSAAKAMVLVCCWVVLFRTILSYLNHWFLWMFPVWVQVLVTGILELSNGCCELLRITDVKLRCILCAGMLSFGGVCVLLQTVSVVDGLSVRYYIKGKLLQTGFTILICCVIFSEVGFIFTAVIPVSVWILRKIQNRYSNQQSLPV